MAADKVLTWRHLGEPAAPRSFRGRSGSVNTLLLHEGLEQLARLRRFFFAPRSIGFHGKAAGQLCRDKLRNAQPKWNTLDLGAGALREQHRRLKRGFHGRDVLGWHQDCLHRRLPLSANE